MKNILILLFFFQFSYSNSWGQVTGVNPGFDIEIEDYYVFKVSQGTVAQQIGDIVRRSLNPPYEKQYDSLFLHFALIKLDQVYNDQEGAKKLIEDLKEWRSYISSPEKRRIINKDQYERFLKQTKNKYGIEVKILDSNDIYDVLGLGEVQLQLIKKTIRSRREKIPIPQGGLYLIAPKQSLI